MISLICFESDLLIPKEEAEKLNLKYEIPSNFGYNNSGQLEIMNSWDYFKDDCIEKNGKYYKNQAELEKEKPAPISNYNLYTKYTSDIDYALVKQDNHLVDLNIFAPKCKYKFFLKETIRSEEPTINNIQIILHTLEEKAAKLISLVDEIQNTTFNSKTNVHVGGGLITTYNDLKLKENACTDELQTELNNGWRIIAACVQPNQRRPDYILGRYNPQLEVDSKPNADR
jgi:hypothetical protein